MLDAMDVLLFVFARSPEWVRFFEASCCAVRYAGRCCLPPSCLPVGAVYVDSRVSPASAARGERTLLLSGPPAELYPPAVRGASQGFVYNIGRGLISLAPWTVGYLADRYG